MQFTFDPRSCNVSTSRGSHFDQPVRGRVASCEVVSDAIMSPSTLFIFSSEENITCVENLITTSLRDVLSKLPKT